MTREIISCLGRETKPRLADDLTEMIVFETHALPSYHLSACHAVSANSPRLDSLPDGELAVANTSRRDHVRSDANALLNLTVFLSFQLLKTRKNLRLILRNCLV